jgi:predicted acyl esterase
MNRPFRSSLSSLSVLLPGLLLLSGPLVGCSSVPPAAAPDMPLGDLGPDAGPDGHPDATPVPDVGSDAADAGDIVIDAPPPGPFKVRQSVEQLHVTHAMPGTTLVLTDSTGTEVARGTTDTLGSLMFRKVPPADGYTIAVDGQPAESVGSLKVVSVPDSYPPQSFYDNQQLQKGFGYVTTRDGTTLSAYITLPGDPANGPYPTVVNYSGYNPSRPGMPLGNFGSLCNDLPALCDAPEDGASLIAALLGYATVSVNMRGTGCSGGAYDYFETLQLLDGYDIIEAVAAQPWVLNHKVGMVGLSYPGISQLFVASVQPPSLAAITPLSVISNTATTLIPGGILNDGFALEWVTNVLDKADPYGQGWEQGQVDAGDMVCAENQLLHGQKVNNVQEAENTPYYVPEVVDPLNPTLFVKNINVPVFIAGAYQDEQTGPYFSTLLDHFAGTPLLRATTYNGVHVDGFAPQVLIEWSNFLDFYIGKRIPMVKPALRNLAGVLFMQTFKATLTLPPDRFTSFTSYDQAFAAYQAEQPVRAIFENGAGPGATGKNLGAPVGAWEMHFDSWPPPQTTVLRYYLHTDGSLQATAPDGSDDGASMFTLDPAVGETGNLAPGGDPWDLLPDYAWVQPAEGNMANWVTDPLTADAVFLGNASADLYVRSNVDDADLQVNLIEVRPDGQEMYVQSGWLRASERKLADTSTPLRPDPTQMQADVQPLNATDWVLARVQFPGFGHVFRAGSRIRLTVDTPGGTRAEWRFRLLSFSGPANHQISHSMANPSSLALPLLQGVTAPSPLPPCPSLRGQPCRAYTAVANTPAP